MINLIIINNDDYYCENETELDIKLKTVLALSFCYKEPYELSKFDIKHLKLFRQIIKSKYQFALFNRRYEMFVLVLNDWNDKHISHIKIEMDRVNFN